MERSDEGWREGRNVRGIEEEKSWSNKNDLQKQGYESATKLENHVGLP